MQRKLSVPAKALSLLLVVMLGSFMAAPAFAGQAFAAGTAPYTYEVSSADGAVTAAFSSETEVADPHLTYTALSAGQIASLQGGLDGYDTLFPIGEIKITDGSGGTEVAASDLTLTFDLTKLLRGAEPTHALPDDDDADADEDDADADEDDDEDYGDDEDEDYYDDEDEDDVWTDGQYSANEIVPIDPSEWPAWYTEPVQTGGGKANSASKTGSDEDSSEPYYDAARNVYIIDDNTYVHDERIGGYVFYDEDGQPDYYFPEDADYEFVLGDHSEFTGGDGQTYYYDAASNSYVSATGSRFAYSEEDGVYFSDDYEYFYSYDDEYEYDESELDDEVDADADADDAEDDEDTADGEGADGVGAYDEDDPDDADSDDGEDTDDTDDSDDNDGLVRHGIRELEDYPGWYWNYDDAQERWFVDNKIIESVKNVAYRLEYGSSKYFQSEHSWTKAANRQGVFVFDGKYYKYDEKTGLYKRFKSYESKYGLPILNDGKYHFYFDPDQKTYYEIEGSYYDYYYDDDDYTYDKDYRKYSFNGFWYSYAKDTDTYSLYEPFNRYYYYKYGQYYYDWQYSDYGFYYDNSGRLVKDTVPFDDLWQLSSGEEYSVGQAPFAYASPSLSSPKVPLVAYSYDEDDYSVNTSGAVTGYLQDFTTVNSVRWAKVAGYTELPTSKELQAAMQRAGEPVETSYQFECYGYLPMDDVLPLCAVDSRSHSVTILSSKQTTAEPVELELESNKDGVITFKANALTPFAIKYSYDDNNIYTAPPQPAAIANKAPGSGAGQGALPTAGKNGFGNAGAQAAASQAADAAADDPANSLYGRGVLGKVNKDAASAPELLAALAQQNTWIWIVAGVVVLAVAAGAIALAQQKKKTALRRHAALPK